MPPYERLIQMTALDDREIADNLATETASLHIRTNNNSTHTSGNRDCREQLLFEILNDVRELIHCFTLEGRLLFANRAWMATMGYDQADVTSLSFSDVVRADKLVHYQSLFKRIIAGEEIGYTITTLVSKSGHEIRVRGTTTCHYLDGKPVALRGIHRKVTSQKGIRESLPEACERLDLALKGADLGVWDWNVPTGETFSDPKWTTMLGYSLGEIEPKVGGWERLIHPDDLERVTELLNNHLEARTPYYESEHRVCTKSGEWRWILDRGKVFERDAEGRPIRVTGTHLDITERKCAEQMLHELSLTDDLTSLRNRRGFMTLANQHLKLARRGQGKLLLLYADVDGLKQINDKFGHAEGSQAIINAAELIQGCFRDTDIVARLGGDEFAVLAIEADDGSEELVLKRIKQRFLDFNTLNERPYDLNVSVGAARASLDNGETIETLLSDADAQMYKDKRRKRT
jgi:diguanylate cyclase (GGDEF)-like protein/PAS domain S-box-containing protein